MRNEKQEYGLLGALALLLITAVSTCSPLFSSNPYCDANIYMSIGKSIWEGLIPYRDLYDQKGPIVYFIHALAYACSPGNFLGIYVLELICCFFSLVYILKTTRLWMEHTVALPVSIMFGFLIYCSILMSYGDTVEELTMPILMASLYVFYRYAKLHKIPSRTQALLIGIGIGVVFWMKFTIAATFIGAGAATLILACHRREARPVLQLAAWATGGFAIVTAIVLLFFAYHSAIGDLLNGYIFFNTRHYNTGNEGASDQMWRGYIVIYIVVFGLLWLIPESKSVRLMVISALATTGILLVSVFCYYYYYLVFYAFLPLVGMFLRRLRPQRWVTVFCLCVVLVRFATNYNTRLLLEHRANSFAQPMAEYIEQQGDHNPAILTYDMLNAAIYVQANATPRIRYFFKPNSNYPEIMQQQNDYLHSAQALYVVTPDTLPDTLPYQRVMTTIDYNRGVGADMFMHREKETPVHLYRRVDSE